MSATQLQIALYYNTNGTKRKSREQGKKRKNKKESTM